jgi:hypothetical protein
MKFRDFITEAKEKHAVFAFGRMNPPTIGHEKLVQKVKEQSQLFYHTPTTQTKIPSPHNKNLNTPRDIFQM